jgi:hypothetical protein
LKPFYFRHVAGEKLCHCCREWREDCRPCWVEFDSVMFLCPCCFGFVLLVLRESEVEIIEGGE